MEPIIIDVEFEVISEIEVKQKKLSTKEEWILAYQTLPNWYKGILYTWFFYLFPISGLL